MIRSRWLSLFLVPLLMNRVGLAGEHPSESWCIPAIQRDAQTQTEPTPLSGALSNYGPCSQFDGTLARTADCLYQEAVTLDDAGQPDHAECSKKRSQSARELLDWISQSETLRERAAEKFLTLLEECPDYHQREDVVRRLNDIVKNWLDEARERKQHWHEETRLFVISTHSSRELTVTVSATEARARKVLETIQVTAFRKVIDPETFLWYRSPTEYSEGEDWLEDVFVELPLYDSDSRAIGTYFGSSFWGQHSPMTPARRWFSSAWKRTIFMQFQCEEKGGSSASPDPHLPSLSIILGRY